MSGNLAKMGIVASAITILSATGAGAAVCPTIGASVGCAVIITRAADGTFSIANTGQGPYDGSDDTLVGVVNNGPNALTSIALTGNNIFGFDGDGIVAYPGGGNYGPTGYEGPNTSFTITNANSGIVNFLNGGIAAGASAYFSLEENLTGATGTQPPITVGPGVPEPATWAMLITGFAVVGVAARRRRTAVLA